MTPAKESKAELCKRLKIKFPYKCPCCDKIIRGPDDIKFIKSSAKKKD